MPKERCRFVGINCEPQFLSASQSALPPAFGLCQPNIFFKLLQGTEAKIQWVRNQFEKSKEHHSKIGEGFDEGLIAYRPTEYHSPIPMGFLEMEIIIIRNTQIPQCRITLSIL